jgi:hypothetical protein
VGSDGTVYGWGVTDVTSYTMHHQAYVTTTLTSPKGRKDGPVYGSAQNSVRVDVALGFVPSDVGIYLVESTNQGYCYACNCWILNSGSGASANNAAYPTNFTEKGWGKEGCCTLEFTYTWGSSSMNLADLADCTMGEYVTSSLGTGTVNWPPPMVQQATYPIGKNFTWDPTTGIGSDEHLAPSSFTKPYEVSQPFTDTQIYRYKCPGVQNGAWQTLPGGPYQIKRWVSDTNGVWQYQITKADGSLTYNLP